MKEESPETDSVLKIEPKKSATGEVGATMTRYAEIPAITDLNRRTRKFEHHIQCVHERHVPAVMEGAIGDEVADYLAKPFIPDDVPRWRPCQIVKGRELILR